MEYSQLINIRNKIDQLPQVHQIEILRILYKTNTKLLSENNSGVHINLINVDIHTLNEIQVYLNYVHDQELVLYATEKQKDQFKKEFKNICLDKTSNL